MGLPLDLFLVRHGESEGNVALRASRGGDDYWYEQPEFADRHSSLWRLTDRGIAQAEAAGEWLREETGGIFDRYYVSKYLRAKETAVHLGLPDATWYSEFYLREREWGDLDVMSETARKLKFAEHLRRLELDAFYVRPPNGESYADLCLRIDRILETFHRECDGKRIVVVCHGEVMWTFRLRLERMSVGRFRELDASRNPFDHINNCQILHYTRRDPFGGETISPYPGFMRSVCPWDMSLSSNIWTPIERKGCSNEDLEAELARYPRVINAPLS